MISTRDYSSLADPQLVELVRRGDERAKTALFDRHQPDVFSQMFRMLGDYDQAHSVTQLAFITAFERLHQHRPEDSFGGWVSTIAERTCFNYIEARDLPNVPLSGSSNEDTDKIMLQPGIQVPDQHDNPLQRLVSFEQGQALADALARLDPRYRTAVTLRFWQGRSLQQIAEEMQVPIGTAGSYVSRGKEQLGALLHAES